MTVLTSQVIVVTVWIHTSQCFVLQEGLGRYQVLAFPPPPSNALKILAIPRAGEDVEQ